MFSKCIHILQANFVPNNIVSDFRKHISTMYFSGKFPFCEMHYYLLIKFLPIINHRFANLLNSPDIQEHFCQ